MYEALSLTWYGNTNISLIHCYPVAVSNKTPVHYNALWVLVITHHPIQVTGFGPSVHFNVRRDSGGYVDDFLIVYRSKYVHFIERHVQRSLNMLSHWADTNGFKFSCNKTVCMHFCRLHSAHPIQNLHSMVLSSLLLNKTKFLGVIFDNKLAFLPHIRYLKEKCVKALNLLHVVAHTSWGADQHTLLHLYRSLVHSKLDYGSVVYGSTRESYLRMLDPIQIHALRLCIGTFRTSPASSICV